MDTIIDYFAQNIDNLLYLIAGASLLIELALIGLSGPLLFFAIGCALTGLLVSLNIIVSWEVIVLFVGLFTLLSGVILWKPLKQFQGSGKVTDNSSDMIGQMVKVSKPVDKKDGAIRYSGIDWNARITKESERNAIDVGELVEIISVDGNVMIIK